MVTSAVWPGTVDEASHLLDVIARNCECHFRGDKRLDACGLHLMLMSPRVVSGLIFMRRHADRLRREEFAA